MKLGLGLYRHQLNADHYAFARQCGCTHVVAHLVDYFRTSRDNGPGDQPVGDDAGWGLAGDPDKLWSFEELSALKREINEAGLELEAIENFDPAHWHDVLLDGPQKKRQLENLKSIIRNIGRAGIPVMGYNVHFRNVRGKVPHYRETFVDDGQIDMLRVLRILKMNGYDGVLIPDHAPQVTCAAPWHAGMAFALGYMKAVLQSLDTHSHP